MKCLHCGKASDTYLCSACTTPIILDTIFNQICSYDPDACENPYLAAFAAGLTEKRAERNIIPDILGQFDFAVTEYYYCRYFRMCRDARFEDAAVSYLQTHDLSDIRTQNVLLMLIQSYIYSPKDYIKPRKWCDIVAETDNLCCELYVAAAYYFAMIGEYTISKLEKQRKLTNRYRTKRPYWPITEDRRRAIAAIYDKKGIKYPRITFLPKKVPENEFAPINECRDEDLSEYCVFWCSEVFSLSAARSIYQIAAVKVCENAIKDSFESFIRPWNSGRDAKNTAAREAGVSVDVLESAEDVDIVMEKFFAFVGDDVLVSVGALGNQGKLISRAARYTGMKEIKNEFLDLLDLAADISVEFDFSNNTREYLLSRFSIFDGKTALEKARANKQLYDALKNHGDRYGR